MPKVTQKASSRTDLISQASCTPSQDLDHCTTHIQPAQASNISNKGAILIKVLPSREWNTFPWGFCLSCIAPMSNTSIKPPPFLQGVEGPLTSSPGR